MLPVTPLIILFPLLGFFTLGLFGARIKSEKTIGIIGSGAVGLSFLVALILFSANARYAAGTAQTDYRTILLAFFLYRYGKLAEYKYFISN